MPTPKEIAERFRDLNFHDDTLVDVKVLPSQQPKQGPASQVEIRLRYSEDKLRVIRFCGCANLRIAMDFDVLAGNLAPNTSRVDAHTELDKMRHLMESQVEDWDVGYGGISMSPLAWKLAALHEFVFFRVQFFGGAVDIIAREYQLTILDEVPPQATSQSI